MPPSRARGRPFAAAPTPLSLDPEGEGPPAIVAAAGSPELAHRAEKGAGQFRRPCRPLPVEGVGEIWRPHASPSTDPEEEGPPPRVEEEGPSPHPRPRQSGARTPPSPDPEGEWPPLRVEKEEARRLALAFADLAPARLTLGGSRGKRLPPRVEEEEARRLALALAAAVCGRRRGRHSPRAIADRAWEKDEGACGEGAGKRENGWRAAMGRERGDRV